MMNQRNTLLGGLLLMLLAVGCTSSDATTSESSKSKADRSAYLLDVEPTDALAIGKARDSVSDQQDVTIVGNIGGSASPFVNGIAAFTVVDLQVKSCAEEEGCPTPWDYCCTQNEVKNNIATVKLVDSEGQPVLQSAKDLLGVKELSTVVVQGKAERDDAGNLTIAATKIFIKQL